MLAAPLPAGYRLEAYTIDCEISGGGFGRVYKARDAEGTTVAIKEYLPLGVVERMEGGAVRPLSDRDRGVFRYGMRCFFEEGRALANLRHPNVVRVTNFFRANDTAYMVMHYEHGKTLQQLIQHEAGPMHEGFVMAAFIQLLNGLREVHTRKLLHLDIKPANIYIRKDRSPVLMDFGAARQALVQGPPAIAPMYTPGYAAPEFYKGRDRLGPWTDIYSIGASLVCCLSRRPPPPADQRLKEDTMVPVAQAYAGTYAQPFLELIDTMLAVNYLERPQSVFALQKRLVELARESEKARPGLLSAIKQTLGLE